MKAVVRIMDLIRQPVTGLVFRVYIGGVFLAASMYKINYPGEFAETIASYQLVPVWGVHLMALVLPWTELITGLMMILGIRTRVSAALITAMLLVFCVAILATLARGIPIGCGCFTTVEDPIGWTTLLRDLVWLAMSIHVFVFPSAWQLEDRLWIAVKEIVE